jgi:hypothetical protein
MMAMDVITQPGGLWAAVPTLTGIIVGHVWWLLVHRDPATAAPWTSAPDFVKGLVGSGAVQGGPPGQDRRGYGAAAAPRGRTLNDGGGPARAAPSGSRAGTSGTGGGYNWGSGQKLGAE